MDNGLSGVKTEPSLEGTAECPNHLDRVVAAILGVDGLGVYVGEWPGPASEQMN